MLKFLQKVFGTKHDKDVQRMLPMVEEINEEFKKLASLSDDELRAKTDEFKALIQERIAEIKSELEEIQQRLRTEDMPHEERLDIYTRINALEKEEYETIQATLDEILPQAFAVVKETCRRLVGTTYTVAGQTLTWDMVPYDVQMMGGIIIHEGKISEMATGEGKTLVGVAPMYLNALAGRGVHLVTVNDYLAKRDSEWMGIAFNRLGVTVGCIQSQMQPDERKEHYGRDITYGTNNEFGFDYLRDNMVTDAEDMVQRRHFFAIVDEVDSVLVDEARTPLIISGAVAHVDQRFEEMNPRVRRLVEAQMKLANSIVAEAERLLKSQKKEEREQAGIALLRAYRGLPKHSRLTKLLNDPENKKLLQDTEITYLGEQGTKMQEIDEELYYSVEEKNHQIDITEKGRALLAGDQNDPDMFLIPDIAGEMSAIEGNSDTDPEERQRLKDESMRIYADRSDRIHTVNQLLRAYSLYDRDDEYVVQDGKVKIVDEFTGRILEGRRYSDGLHQAIEAKEGVFVERDTQTLATVTLQNYFRLYRKLAGMTGTAETEAGEFYQIYKLDVVVIPTNRAIVRKDLDDLVYRTKREKYNAVIEEIQNQVKQNRAVLVGTTSVEVSEVLSKMLRRVNVPHNVLNAKQHQREAEIVSEAGRKGGVTIATNMAGRGTDIKLVAEVKAAGGLCIIGTERHESRRIDRQLRGRAGRQGDPGSSQFFISLEDDLMRLFGGARIAAVMQKLNVPEGEPIQHSMVTKSVERAQKKVEENNFGVRKRLLEYDNVMNQQREVVYDRRRHALMGERVKGELFEYIEEMAGAWYDEFHPENQLDLLKDEVRTHLLSEIEINDKEFAGMKRDDVVEKILEAAQKFYQRKEEMLGPDFMANLERIAVLQTIDEKWREHLRAMDELKEGIHLRAYGQKDPLLEYKAEAYRMFIELIREVNKESVHFAFKYFPQIVERQVPVRQEQQVSQQQRPAQQRENNGLPNMNTVSVTRSMSFSHPTATPPFASAHEPVRMPELPPESPAQQENREAAGMPKVPVRNNEPKVGRNDPCWCGSGKKFKNCHGQ